MRTRLYFIATIGFLFLSSCEKEQIIQEETNDEIYDQYQNVYNSDNMTAVPWDELPEIIRNAEILGDGLTTKDIGVDSRDDCDKYELSTPAHGSHGGGVFVMMPESSCDRILALVVQATNSIKAVLIIYKREDGSAYIQPFAGGTSGTWLYSFFDEGEVITSYATAYTNTVNFLRLGTYSTITNQNLNLLEFGQQNGTFTPFFWGPSQHVLGFYGEDGNRINRLGALVYTDPNNW